MFFSVGIILLIIVKSTSSCSKAPAHAPKHQLVLQSTSLCSIATARALIIWKRFIDWNRPDYLTDSLDGYPQKCPPKECLQVGNFKFTHHQKWCFFNSCLVWPKLDKAPRPSISNVIWILSFDTICQLNPLFSKSEAAMLSSQSYTRHLAPVSVLLFGSCHFVVLVLIVSQLSMSRHFGSWCQISRCTSWSASWSFGQNSRWSWWGQACGRALGRPFFRSPKSVEVLRPVKVRSNGKSKRLGRWRRWSPR